MGEAKRRYLARDGLIGEISTTTIVLKASSFRRPRTSSPSSNSIHRDREIMSNTGDMKLVGRLPVVIVEDLIRRGIYDDPDAFDRWWNSIEANPWRIWKGRL